MRVKCFLLNRNINSPIATRDLLNIAACITATYLAVPCYHGALSMGLLLHEVEREQRGKLHCHAQLELGLSRIILFTKFTWIQMYVYMWLNCIEYVYKNKERDGNNYCVHVYVSLVLRHDDSYWLSALSLTEMRTQLWRNMNQGYTSGLHYIPFCAEQCFKSLGAYFCRSTYYSRCTVRDWSCLHVNQVLKTVNLCCVADFLYAEAGSVRLGPTVT